MKNLLILLVILCTSLMFSNEHELRGNVFLVNKLKSNLKYEGALAMEYGYTYKYYMSEGSLKQLLTGSVTATPTFIVSPLHAEGGFNFTWSILPFISLSNKLTFGTGWDSMGLEGLQVKDNNENYISAAASDALLRNLTTLNIQMNFGVFNKKTEWDNVLFTNKSELLYQKLLHYEDGKRFTYLLSENINGLSFTNTTSLGYLIPINTDKVNKHGRFRNYLNKDASIIILNFFKVAAPISGYYYNFNMGYYYGLTMVVNLPLNIYIIQEYTLEFTTYLKPEALFIIGIRL